MEVIQAHAKHLNETPAATMKIQGNTDYRGSHEYNLSLGQKRSVAVKEALNSFGVDDSQIETVSYGKEYANLDCVEQNSCGEDRRADIVYTVE
jgi:peptidoglycan-associated lipoprotein